LSEIAKTINKTNKVDSVLQQILKNIHQLKQEILDLNNYSKKNIEKIELINIDDKPENTNSDNEKYKHKHPDLNTNRSHIIDKFNVKRNNNMLYLFDNNFNTVSTNLKKLKNISKITNVLQSFDNEDSVILQKNLQSYLDRIEKTEKLIKLGKIEESELSEKLTDQFINIVERSFVYKIIDSIYRAMAVNKLPDMYTALLKAINEYLEQLSIYTFDSNDIQLGKKLSDSYLDYYNIETFNVSTESEHGNVREIQLLAYYVPFLNENNEADQYWIRGRVIINKFKEA
jgi:sulfur relay (sulfurtransferase) DsrF/TusC family protein